MKPKHNVRFIKNLGQFVISPLLGLLLAIAAVMGGSIPGYFGFIFGAFIWFAMTFIILFIYDKVVVQKAIRENEEQEKEYKEHIHRLMEEENDPDAFSEYDETNYVDDRFEEEKTGIGEYEKRKEKENAEREARRAEAMKKMQEEMNQELIEDEDGNEYIKSSLPERDPSEKPPEPLIKSSKE